MPGKPEDVNPNRAVYLLPAATQFETSGSCTASNRSIQWREKVIEPLWESRSDHMIMYEFAQKLGFAEQLCKNYKMQQVKGRDEPVPEDILREINKSVWTIGYTGQSPERLKAHMRNMGAFDVKTLKAKGKVVDKETGYDMTGDYFGLPWPCYGTPELKHPGSPNLYDTSKHVMEGGGNFRANFGVERNGASLLAEDGSHSVGAEITTGYPEFDHVLLKKLGWWADLSEAEQKAAEGKNWKTDPTGAIIRVAMKHGCHPFGNAKARAVVWNFPDAIPQHREPVYGTRPDLIAKYPSHDDQKTRWRLPILYKSLQAKNVEEKMHEKFPLIMTSGRLVEYEGGGEETRSNPWLAELQQEMFVEINPAAATARGIRNGERVWVTTPTGARINVQALVTERVGADTVFLPFHFSGRWQGEDMKPYYPDGAFPVVRGLGRRLERLLSGAASRAVHHAVSAGGVIPSMRTRCTLFYSDIRDFSSVAEANEPEEVVHFLNRLLAIVVDEVKRAGGDVDKLIGDAVLARFQGEDAEARAIQAARAALAATVSARLPRGIGIGLYTGEVISGTVGSADRMDFTVIGDSVNLAARLCAAAARGEIVADADTVAAAGIRRLGGAGVRGRRGGSSRRSGWRNRPRDRRISRGHPQRRRFRQSFRQSGWNWGQAGRRSAHKR